MKSSHHLAKFAVLLCLSLATVGCRSCQDSKTTDDQSDKTEDIPDKPDTPSDTANPDTAAEFSPSDIPGIQLWLSGEQGVQMQDGVVTRWKDQSGNGHDLTQPTSGRRPSLATDAINGRDAVDFSGKSQRLIRDDMAGLQPSDDRTVFVVVKLDDKTDRQGIFIQSKLGSAGTSSNSYGLEANTFRTKGERFGLYMISQGYDSEVETNLEFNVLTIRTEGFPDFSEMESGTTFYFNGETRSFSQSPGGVDNPTFKGDRTAVGGFANKQAPSDAVLDGKVAEVLLYRGALSDEQVSDVHDYLLKRYDLP